MTEDAEQVYEQAATPEEFTAAAREAKWSEETIRVFLLPFHVRPADVRVTVGNPGSQRVLVVRIPDRFGRT